MTTRVFILILAGAATAAPFGAAHAQTLEAFASLPADTFAPGPTSGRFITPANGRVPPFVGKQPVQGVSSVLQASGGDYWVMSDNGFGAKNNSPDYVLRMLPHFAGLQEAKRRIGNGEGQGVHHAARPEKEDHLPDRRRSADVFPAAVSRSTPRFREGRLLTGGRLRHRIGPRGARRDALVRRRVRAVPDTTPTRPDACSKRPTRCPGSNRLRTRCSAAARRTCRRAGASKGWPSRRGARPFIRCSRER